MAVHQLEEVEQFVIVGPRHPWSPRPSVRISELQGQSFIMQQAGSRSRIWRREQFLTPITRAFLPHLSDQLPALRDVIAEKQVV